MDPLSSADHILNSFYAGAINFTTDIYEAHVSNNVLGNVANNEKLSANFRNRVKSALDPYEKTALDASKARSHRTRNWINSKAQSWKLPKWMRPSSAEEFARTQGRRRLMADAFAPGSMDKFAESAADRDFLKQIKAARGARSWGTTALGVMAASAAAGLASSAIRATIEQGHRAARVNTSFSSGAFIDSQMAMTTRQRALRAIQNSQSGMRRALGNEANFLHTYR